MLAFLAGSLFYLPLTAQQKDSLLVTEKDSVLSMAQEVGSDTLAMDMNGVEQMEQMAVDSNSLKDKSLSLIIDEVMKKYDLQDQSDAARYDSLWMKELYENASLSDEMYREVAELDYEKAYPTSLHTDTLKARLAKLNQKTPFNVEYNPSLENVIRSFLFRKRDLMERMLTASQFYFPLFEQELDNHDIPLEMKYLSIVESALNPRARSRVGATGLWQFMYPTGKSYNLNVGTFPIGDYSFIAKVEGTAHKKEGTFSIIPFQAEMLETKANHQLLFNLSFQSGGKMFFPNQIEELIKEITNSNNNKTIVHIKEKVQEMINIQWILFTLLLLICTEWFIRKYNGLY